MTSNRNYQLDVEAFSLFADGASVHYEADPDLSIGVNLALTGNRDVRANQAALVLIELGIDGHETHRVRVDRTGNYPGPGEDAADYADAFNYPRSGSEAFILGDAIEACQAVLDQLFAMRTAEEARLADAARRPARVNLDAHAPQYREADEKHDAERDA